MAEAAEGDLGLALHYVPRRHRAAVADLFALDAALGDVVRTTTDEMVGAIRLAWWRERLEDLDAGKVAAEPHLEALAPLVADGTLIGEHLGNMIDGWQAMLRPFPWEGEVVGAVAKTGSLLFGYVAIVLGASVEEMKRAMSVGAMWRILDAAKRCSDAESRATLVEVAGWNYEDLAKETMPASVRPLTMLGVLAGRDIKNWPRAEAEASPARAWAMIAHRLTGKFPAI